MAETYSAGIVTAYGAAVRGGYTGTYEQFCAEQAQFGANAAKVAQDRAAVEAATQTFTTETVPGAVQTVQQTGAAQVQAVEAASETEQQQIALAGAAQETRVTQAGDDQVDAVEEAGATQVGNVNTAGTTQVGNVNTAGTTQVGAVNTAGATQVQAVEDKGQEVIDSIPEDYTELTEDVSSLKSALGDSDKSTIAVYGGGNLLRYANFTDGKFRNAQDGSYPTNANYCYSSPIYVKPNSAYQLSAAYHTCFLDADKNFISGVWINTTLVTPANCYWLQVSPPIADKATATLVEKVSGDVGSKMFSGNSKNLLSNTVWEDQYYYAYNTGNRTWNANYSNSGLINIGANTPIYLHNMSNTHTVFYDADGNYIDGSLASFFATPANCVYMRVSIPTADKTNALILRYDREDKIKVGTGSDMIPRLNVAYALSALCDKPIYIYGGEYDVGTLFSGHGFTPVNDVIGVGMPRLYVNKASFDVNQSCFMLNRPGKSITIDGFILEVTNGRYCVHDEMGANASGQAYTHKIKNCVMKQNTEIQSGFTYPRCVGIGLGNSGLISIENCIMESNVDEEVDAHTGYNGQTENAVVFVKDCVMPSGTVSATYAGAGSGYTDTVVVTNCLVNAAPKASDSETVNLIAYNNHIAS